MKTLLEVKNLVTRFYTKEGIIHAVNGLSYTLDEGESMAIVGESGSGKSVGVMSILRLISSPPGQIESGEALFKGKDLLVATPEELRQIRGNQIAIIFQDPMTSLNPVLTVERQLTEALKTHLGLSKNQARQKAVEMITLVGIPNAEERLSYYPHQFSGGQRQRLMIAMALACEPALLIADEPTTALDVTIQAQIAELIKQLQRRFGMAVIWITHDLGVVAGLVDKVAVMYAGFIIEQAPVRALYKTPSHPYTIGLLRSIPKIDSEAGDRLVPIEGLPPDVREVPNHCLFAPRCPFAVDRCWQELPPLMEAGLNHFSACWRWEHVRQQVETGERP